MLKRAKKYLCVWGDGTIFVSTKATQIIITQRITPVILLCCTQLSWCRCKVFLPCHAASSKHSKIAFILTHAIGRSHLSVQSHLIMVRKLLCMKQQHCPYISNPLKDFAVAASARRGPLGHLPKFLPAQTAICVGPLPWPQCGLLLLKLQQPTSHKMVGPSSGPSPKKLNS